MYWAHRAVFFAIAQLSCLEKVLGFKRVLKVFLGFNVQLKKIGQKITTLQEDSVLELRVRMAWSLGGRQEIG